MLADADPTVRQAAAEVLTPLPSHTERSPPSFRSSTSTTSRCTSQPAAPARLRLTKNPPRLIDSAAAMLAHANPRARGPSYVLGRLRCDAAIARARRSAPMEPRRRIEIRLAPHRPGRRIARPHRQQGQPRRADVARHSRPRRLNEVPPRTRNKMSDAMAGARSARPPASRPPRWPTQRASSSLAPTDFPSPFAPPPPSRSASSPPPANPPRTVNFIAMYESPYEDHATKFESLKALGNLRRTASADGLKKIAEADLTPDLRWIAHWSNDRIAAVTTPYVPPTIRRHCR